MRQARSRTLWRAALPLVLAWALGGGAAAAPIAAQSDSQPRTLSVNGEGEASAPPDVAYVSVGVQTQNESAAAAVAENSRRMTSVLDALRAQGLGPRDLQTSGLSVSPQFDRGNQQITGYQATNNATATLNDVDRAGEVLDAALRSGANRVGGLRFGIRDTDGLRDQALAEAARSARARADALATSLGLRVTGIHSVTEGSVAVPRPAPMMAASEAAPRAVAPPVESGELRVTAQVRVTFLFEP